LTNPAVDKMLEFNGGQEFISHAVAFGVRRFGV
jgi:hypothetical protein